jgi:hypothetical protein
MRPTIAVIVGLLVCGICATCLNLILRLALPGYAAAEPQMQFTTVMMLARLALPGGIPSVAAGFSSTWISPRSGRATAVLIGVLLLIFLPSHYYLWTKFPVWYHVTFLGSLVLFTWLGAKLRMRTVAPSALSESAT